MTAAPILVVTGLAREARIAGGPGVVALAGGAAAALAERIEAAVREHQPKAIVSFGLAGALAPGLQPGDLVAGSAVLAGAARFECDLEWRGAILAALASRRGEGGSDEVLAPFPPKWVRFGDEEARQQRKVGAFPGSSEPEKALVFGADAMITHAAAKRSLHLETGAAVVDMESAAAAHVAAAHGLPFAVIRAVSDSADQSLPPAVLSGMKPDGRMDLGGVLASLARDPRQLPALIRTGREAERGFRALDHARRLLGPRLGRPNLGELLLDVG